MPNSTQDEIELKHLIRKMLFLMKYNPLGTNHKIPDPFTFFEKEKEDAS